MKRKRQWKAMGRVGRYRHYKKRGTAKRKLAKRSIRTVRIGKHGKLLRVGCPKGYWKRGRCRKGLKAFSMLVPAGRSNPAFHLPAGLQKYGGHGQEYLVLGRLFRDYNSAMLFAEQKALNDEIDVPIMHTPDRTLPAYHLATVRWKDIKPAYDIRTKKSNPAWRNNCDECSLDAERRARAMLVLHSPREALRRAHIVSKAVKGSPRDMVAAHGVEVFLKHLIASRRQGNNPRTGRRQ